MFNFENLEYLILILLIIPLFVFLRKKENINKIIFITLSFLFLIISISRPIIKHKDIEITDKNKHITIAIDLSNNMLATDIFPNRLETSKNKIIKFIKASKNKDISIFGFNSNIYNISPSTTDKKTLNFLIKNLNINNFIEEGFQDFNSLLEHINYNITDKEKSIIIFTANFNEDYEFTKEIKYANENNIRIFIYNIGTNKGIGIKNNEKYLTDEKGNIKIFKINNNISKLAKNTNGIYFNYKSSNDFINEINNNLNSILHSKKIIIKKNKELFKFSMIISILFLFLFLFLKGKNNV